MTPIIKRGILDMTLAMVMSGTIGWFVLQSGQTPINVVFWRCLIGAPVLTYLCHRAGALSIAAIGARRFFLAVLGGVALVLNWLALFSAYPLASISVATIVYNVQPFLLVGLGLAFLNEPISRDRLAWLAVAFAGTAVMTLGGAQIGSPTGTGGYLLGIFSRLPPPSSMHSPPLPRASSAARRPN